MCIALQRVVDLSDHCVDYSDGARALCELKRLGKPPSEYKFYDNWRSSCR